MRTCSGDPFSISRCPRRHRRHVSTICRLAELHTQGWLRVAPRLSPPLSLTSSCERMREGGREVLTELFGICQTQWPEIQTSRLFASLRVRLEIGLGWNRIVTTFEPKLPTNPFVSLGDSHLAQARNRAGHERYLKCRASNDPVSKSRAFARQTREQRSNSRVLSSWCHYRFPSWR